MRENLQHHRVMSDMKAFQAHIDFSCSKDITLLPGKGPFLFPGNVDGGHVVSVASLLISFASGTLMYGFYFTCRSCRISTKSSFIFCSYVQVF